MSRASRLASFPEWHWDVPECFNIGVACTDAHLGTPVESRVAMIVEDDALGTRGKTVIAHEGKNDAGDVTAVDSQARGRRRHDRRAPR